MVRLEHIEDKVYSYLYRDRRIILPNFLKRKLNSHILRATVAFKKTYKFDQKGERLI